MSAPQATRTTALHAGAWWLWALGLATAASRTTNPLLLGLLVRGGRLCRRRPPHGRAVGALVRRVRQARPGRASPSGCVFAFFLGSPIPGTHTLVTLPEVPLPDWAQGVRIGGRVTAEGLVFALYDGLKLATLLICVGAANALANPARLLKSLPGALYEAGVAVVVAMTFAPNLVADVQRLRAARRLRGRPDRWRQGAPPGRTAGAGGRAGALGGAGRGDGRARLRPYAPRSRPPSGTPRPSSPSAGCSASAPVRTGCWPPQGAVYGLPLLLAGLAAALAGLRLGGRRSVRTRYRPDRWGVRAWLVAGSGAAVAAADDLGGRLRPGGPAPAAPSR